MDTPPLTERRWGIRSGRGGVAEEVMREVGHELIIKKNRKDAQVPSRKSLENKGREQARRGRLAASLPGPAACPSSGAEGSWWALGGLRGSSEWTRSWPRWPGGRVISFEMVV